MRIIASIFLFLFIAILATPTIVSIVEKSCDTSVYFSISEEEHAQKEIKVFNYNDQTLLGFVLYKDNKSNLIRSLSFSRHDKITTNIFSPPPDLI